MFQIVVIIIIILLGLFLWRFDSVRDELLAIVIPTKPVQAIATFNQYPKNNANVSGNVTFKNDLSAGDVIISCELTSTLPNGKYGMHIHEFGDLSNGCATAGDHFNPYNKTHGDASNGHAGDLGNIEFIDGNAKMLLRSKQIKLKGNKGIIGRALIIHANEDDLGTKDDELSIINGNSGKRIACSIIGLSQ